MLDHPGAGHEVTVGILRIDPAFDGVAALFQLLLFQCQDLIVGYPDLFFHQVDTDDAFGDRVLNLQAGVHLEKVVIQAFVDYELDRAGARVIHRSGSRDGKFSHLFPYRRGQQRRWSLFDHLLVAALDRTFPLEEVNGVAVVIGQDLELDMVGRFDVFFNVNRVVAEGRPGFGAGRPDGIQYFVLFLDQPHPFSSAAGRCFDHHRQPDFPDHGKGFVFVADRFGRPRNNGHPGCDHVFSRRYLIAHRPDRIARRADENDPFLLATV